MLNSGDIVLALMLFKLDASRAYVTRPYLIQDGTTSSIDEQTVADVLWETPFRELTRVTARPAAPEGVWIRRIHPTTSSILASQTASFGVSRPVQGSLPAQCSALITTLSDDPNLCRNGKVYCPFVGEQLCSDQGRLLPIGITLYTSAAGWLAQTLPATSGAGDVVLVPVNFSRKNGTWSTWANARVSRFLSAQRRRSGTQATTPLPYGDGPPSV